MSRKTRRSTINRRDDDPFGYVDSSHPEEGIDNPDSQELGRLAFASVDAQASIDNEVPGFVDDDGVSFISINEFSNTYSLDPDPITGNVLLASTNPLSPWATMDNIVVGDEAGRFLHYYPNVMAKYGVSRFRLSNETTIPKDAEIISLAPVDIRDDLDVYAAVSLRGDVFMTVSCNIQGQFTKVFLVQDLESGVEKLKEEKLRYTVTGGIVEDCFYLPFVAPASAA